MEGIAEYVDVYSKIELSLCHFYIKKLFLSKSFKIFNVVRCANIKFPIF